MLSIDEIRTIVGNCKFEDWNLEVKLDGNRPYLQVHVYNGKNTVTGEPLEWTGRKWMISPHMVPNEIVSTAFKAVMTAMEHEIRESFKYRDVAIYNPHLDPDKLVEFVLNSDNIQERKNVEFAA